MMVRERALIATFDSHGGDSNPWPGESRSGLAGVAAAATAMATRLASADTVAASPRSF
jgi:hypothetical protein